jgi:hypothetical protein
LRRGRT